MGASPIQSGSASSGFTAEEWRARVELAACYRVFAHLGWTELSYNHVPRPRWGPVIEIPEEVQRKSTRDSLQFSDAFGAGRDVFDALVRMIDRSDPSYEE